MQSALCFSIHRTADTVFGVWCLLLFIQRSFWDILGKPESTIHIFAPYLQWSISRSVTPALQWFQWWGSLRGPGRKTRRIASCGGSSVVLAEWRSALDLVDLVNVNKKLWNITIFNGKIHYKWSFSIAMLNFQRVDLVERMIIVGRDHHPDHGEWFVIFVISD